MRTMRARLQSDGAMSMARARSASSHRSHRRSAPPARACGYPPKARSSPAFSPTPATTSSRSSARARATRSCVTRSRRYGSGAPIATRRSAPARPPSSARWSCPTSVADYRPQLTHAAKPATIEVQAYNERGEMVPTSIAGEHPLTIYVDKREIVTIMTLGHAPEALVIGYLRNQRLVPSLEEIRSVQVDWETESAAVVTTSGKELAIGKRTVTSGCGQGTVFGDLMEEIDEIKLRDDVLLTDENLFLLLDKVRRHETIYKQAGAVHGCALADTSGEILMFVEDVGRHNAVDAIAGFMWLERLDCSDKVFYTTGRP